MKYGNRNPRSLWKRAVSSPFSLSATLIIFGLLCRATWNVHEKAQLSDTRLRETEASLEKIRDRETDLSQKVSYLSTDDGIKSEIREKFRAAETGESVAVIVEDQTASSTTLATTTVAKPGFWARIFSVF